MPVKELKSKPKVRSDDFDENGEHDEIRTMKAMSRARAVQKNQEANLQAACDQQHAKWKA